MRIALRLGAAAAATALGLTGLAAAQALPAAGSTASTARIRLVGIERNGRTTSVTATVYGMTYSPIFADGAAAVSVPAGPAWIAADVNTTGPQDAILSTTLVVRRVDITRSEKIDLDARPGKLVRFSLAATGASDTGDSVQVCVGGNFVGGFGMQAGGNAGTVYVVPVRAAALDFGYASSWQGSAASYLIAGQSGDGVPSRPDYHIGLSSMARVAFSFRTGEVVGGYRHAGIQSNDSCGLGGSLVPVGPARTEYLSAGSWTASAYGYRSFWQISNRLAAGHSYAVSFGAAAWGPSQFYPSVQGRQLVFFPMTVIADPAAQTGTECCDISSISLSSGGRVIAHAVLSEWRADRTFSAPLTRTAWYTLRVSAHRWVPGLPVPADVLSPRDAIVWRFRAGPEALTSIQLVPVTMTRFTPQGLNLENQAAPGASTVLSVQVVPARMAGFQPPPRYAVRTVTVEVSFNNGKTWQSVTVHGRGTSWQATVHDPVSGYVSLRSTVTDSAGDSTTETIYQAYAVGSAVLKGGA